MDLQDDDVASSFPHFEVSDSVQVELSVIIAMI